jgi:hypothetical protein
MADLQSIEGPDLLGVYVPDFSTLDPVKVQDARDRLATRMRALLPDLDTRPGTPFGDLWLHPAAYSMTALELALGRFMSDLDLENVAGGTIWNCPFIAKYLGNFSVYGSTRLQSGSGMVRLTFLDEGPFTLDRGLVFTAGGVDFHMRLPNSGGFELLVPGSTLLPSTNCAVLAELTPGRYTVDVPVTGALPDAGLLSGTAFTLSEDLTYLETAVASFDFDQVGLADTDLRLGLPELARRTRDTFHAASLNTPHGARHFLLNEFPDLKCVSTAISGDDEMRRDGNTTPGGFLDALVRSNAFEQVETQVLRLEYDPGTETFFGDWNALGTPYQIDSLVSTEDENVTLAAAAYTVVLRTLNNSKCPEMSCAGSVYQALRLLIPMPMDGATPLVPTPVEDGVQWGYFTVTYRHDPMLAPVYNRVDSRDVKPIGVDVLVKYFTPIKITELKIRHKRIPGTQVNRSGAAAEIVAYFKSLGWPKQFSEARIHDALYYAGVEDVVALEVTAHAQWSVASHLEPYGTAAPTGSTVAAYLAALEPLPEVTYASTSDLKTSAQDDFLTSIGDRNKAFLLDASAIVFEEV